MPSIEYDYYNPATGGSTGSIDEIEYLKQLAVERANQDAINALLANTQVVAPGQESTMPSNIFQGPLSGMGLGLGGMGINALINLGSAIGQMGQNRVGLDETTGFVNPWSSFSPSITPSTSVGMDVTNTIPADLYFTPGAGGDIFPFSAVQTGSAIPSSQEGMAPQVFFDSTSAAARAADAAQAARLEAMRQAAIDAALSQVPAPAPAAPVAPVQPVVPMQPSGDVVTMNPFEVSGMPISDVSYQPPTGIPSSVSSGGIDFSGMGGGATSGATGGIVQVPPFTVSESPIPEPITPVVNTGTTGVPGANNPYVLPPVTVPAGTTPQPAAPTVAIPTVTATSVITPTVPSVPLNIPASTATTTQTVATTTTSLPTVTDTGTPGGITFNPNAGVVAAGTGGRDIAAELARTVPALYGQYNMGGRTGTLMDQYMGMYQNLLGQTAIPEAAQRSLEQARLDQAKLQRVQQGQLAAEDIRQAQQAAREAYGARGQVMGQPAIGAEILNREAIRQQREDQARAGYQASMGNVFNAANLQTGNIFQPIGSLVSQTFNPLGAYPQDVYSSNFNAQLARDIAAANNAAAIEAAKYGAQASRQAATTSGLFNIGARVASSPGFWDWLGGR